LLIESTYGNRLHKDEPSTLDELVQIVNTTLRERKGNLVVPAFAVGRTQEMIYHFHHLVEQGRLGHLDIFVDSPMAVAATGITQRHVALFDHEAQRLYGQRGRGKGLPKLHFISDVSESIKLNRVRSGAIIISASGMCDAGRVLHHLRHNLGRPECAVVITGFQAQGTLGRRLVDGEKTVRVLGEEITVRASIHTLGGFSAHADQQALLGWAAGFSKPPGTTFVVHGEPEAANALATELRERHGWTVQVPTIGQGFTI
jgi:metallo-beta-lactamase family protein